MLKAESQVANSNTVKPLRVQLLLLNKYSKSTPVYFVKRLSLSYVWRHWREPNLLIESWGREKRQNRLHFEFIIKQLKFNLKQQKRQEWAENDMENLFLTSGEKKSVEVKF